MKELCAEEFLAHFSWRTDWGLDESIENLSRIPRLPEVEVYDCFAVGSKAALRFHAMIEHKYIRLRWPNAKGQLS